MKKVFPSLKEVIEEPLLGFLWLSYLIAVVFVLFGFAMILHYDPHANLGEKVIELMQGLGLIAGGIGIGALFWVMFQVLMPRLFELLKID